jgi:hypothetical protein
MHRIDTGMSSLFSSRISQPVHDSESNETGQPSSSESVPTLRRIKQQPDRVQGLQRTKTFERILHKPYAHDRPQAVPPRLVEKVLKTDMHPNNGAEPLLFPFLLLEAKREKDAEGFQKTEFQTALPIRRALGLQHELTKLLQTSGNVLDVPGGPLVWFFAFSGEDWRVYAAVAEDYDKPAILSNSPVAATSSSALAELEDTPSKYVSCLVLVYFVPSVC